jgi:hypothetical protein
MRGGLTSRLAKAVGDFVKRPVIVTVTNTPAARHF